MELVGIGGTSEVWRARDTRLNRIVAIKRVKNPSARFEQEARVIAALNHPHICQIYDVGPDYLVLDYIEGGNLHGPLPLEEAIPVALQIVGALEEAHVRGVLHRDLKPSNIKVTSKRSVKLLDFGLAKVLTLACSDTTQTVEGAVLGTAAYMSPEQARGRPLDQRSDVFSFGAVLYEIISGERAFKGSSFLDTLNAVIHDEPAILRTSQDVIWVVTRCLRKVPDDRFRIMAEVREVLEQCASTVPERRERRPSIAVLPFANLSSDKKNEYFSDGLAEDILNALSQVEGLNVAARTSSFFFKGKAMEMSEIAGRLHVAYLLDGSVRRAGRRVRVTVRLVEITNGFRLWSERYDRHVEDIFDVQDEIARAIAERLELTFGAGVRQPTKSFEAYELYLKGRHYWNQRSPSTLLLAKQCFEKPSGSIRSTLLPMPGWRTAMESYAYMASCPPRKAVPGLAQL